MKNTRIFLYAMFCVFFMVSCENSKTPINELESLTIEIENESENLTEEDWDAISMQITEIEEKMSQYEYSDEELKEIGRLKGKCLAHMTKKAVNEACEEVEEFSKQLEGGLEGFMEEFSSSFEDENEE